jgi:dipeptidyl aminopeptidase/acylaminoacyl peptidase
MTGIASEVLSAARRELAQGRPRSAVKELARARKTLLRLEDFDGLAKLLELAREIRASAPECARAAGRLIEKTEHDLQLHSRGRSAQQIEEDAKKEAKERARKARDRHLAAEKKKRPPSVRQYNRAIYVGFGAAAFLLGCWVCIAILSRAQLWPPWQLNCHGRLAGSPTWSPDGRYIAYASSGCSNHIYVISVAGGTARQITDGSGEQPAWSPDGRSILYRSSSGFSVVPAAGGKSRLLRSDDGAYAAAWSPDGRRIAFTHGRIGDRFARSFGSTLYVMDRNGGHVRRLLGHSCNPGTPAWSPDGAKLAFTCDNGLFVMRLSDGMLQRIGRADYAKNAYSTAADSMTPSWSPDGRTIALSGGLWGIELFRADRLATPRAIVADSPYAVIVAVWSPDGRRLAYSIDNTPANSTADNAEEYGDLYVIDPDGSHQRLLDSF